MNDNTQNNKEPTWKAAIIRVLQEAGSPLHYLDITEQAISRGYYKPEGDSPERTVNRELREGVDTFIALGDGIYALIDTESIDAEPVDVEPNVSTKNGDSIIRAFGAYWRTDLVIWGTDAKLYGKQRATSKPIDFGRQKGTYILYDDHTVVYAGQTTELGQRLFKHKTGRLSGRWNRFSWFGLLEPTKEGDLEEVSFSEFSNPIKTIIDSMEALLIEALEPPRNRQGGIGFSDGIEYIQAIDPELDRRKEQQEETRRKEKEDEIRQEVGRDLLQSIEQMIRSR